MNPFSTDRTEVTRTTLAPSNPPVSYARGSGDMLKKLLSISENTRRQLSQQVDVGGDPARHGGGDGAQTRRAVAVPLLGVHRAGRKQQGNFKGGNDGREKLGGVHERSERVEDQGHGHTQGDVIDLVSDGEEPCVAGQPYGVQEDGAVRRDCDVRRESGRHVGVALFDVFAEDYEACGDGDGPCPENGLEYEEFDGDDEAYEHAKDEYAGIEEVDGRQQNDGVRDGGAPYGLPAEVNGGDWWRQLPDFQPISSIVGAGNRDVRGTTVYVDFLGQFKGTRVSSPSGRMAGSRGSAGAKKTGAEGHWETRDGQRTFISAAGTALTGLAAYREYTKSGAKGTKRTKTSSKKGRRKKKKRVTNSH